MKHFRSCSNYSILSNINVISGIRNICVLLLVLANFSSDAEQQNQNVRKKRIRPGTHYALAPHLDYDDAEYNPQAGFEPYWPVGEWVFEETYTTFYTTTSTVPPLVHGRPCPKYYRDIKEVCAHKLQNRWRIHGCNTYESAKLGCYGKGMDHIYGYHTFPTFCRFIDYNTKFSVYNTSVFIHVGRCLNKDPIWHPYNPLFANEDESKPDYHLQRFDYWMAKLNETFFNLTTEPDITVGPPADMGSLLDD